MHSKVQDGFRMKNRMGSNEAVAKARGGGSREAIVEAAERLFLERGFGSVTMDELAEAAGVARRTLYNQFASKEEIFREMLLRVSGQLETAFPPGVETQGDVEDVLRLIARMILGLHKNPEYLGFLRMVVADSRQFPWIAEEFAAVMEPQAEQLVRYLAHLTAMLAIGACLFSRRSRRSGAHLAWIDAAKKRLHHNVLAIALAAKLARVAWAVLNKERTFECVKTRAT